MAEMSLLKDVFTNIVNVSDNLPGYVVNANSITPLPASSLNEPKSSLMIDLNQPTSKAAVDVQENTGSNCDILITSKEVQDHLHLKINETYDDNGENSTLTPKNHHLQQKRSISWKNDLIVTNEYNPEDCVWLNNEYPDKIANGTYINCYFLRSEDNLSQQKILAIAQEAAVALSTENKDIVTEETKENQPEFVNVAMFKKTISQSPLDGGSRQNSWKNLISKKRHYTKRLKTQNQLMNDKIEKSRKKQEKLKLTIEKVAQTIRLKKEEMVDLKLVEKEEWDKYLAGHKEIRELKECYDESKVILSDSNQINNMRN